MMMRRRATQEEIAQGEAEMRLAEKRMQKEAEERGEKPLEDSKEGSHKEVSGEVSAPPIADGVREDSKGNSSPDNTSSAAPGTEMRRPPTLPPAEPPKFAPEEFASPGLRTPKPQDQQDKGSEKATMSSKKETGSNLGPEAFENKKSQARASPTGDGKGTDRRAESSAFPPLFTPEQLQHMAFIHSQAPWLYGQPHSAFTPSVQRPAFLSLEEDRIGREMFEKDQMLEQLREQQQKDQRERDELRGYLDKLAAENQKLRDALNELKKPSEGGDSKFSTPEEAADPLKDAVDPQGQVQRKSMKDKEAADPQKIWSEAAEGRMSERDLFPWRSKEAVDPQRSQERKTEGTKESPVEDRGSGSGLTEKSLEFMAIMVESMKEMQKKVSEGRDDAGMVKGVEVVRTGILELPPLQPCNASQGPLQLGDWLLMVEPVAADMSATSEEWWREMTKSVEVWYQAHMALNPLDRIVHNATPPPGLQQERWQRLERRMSTMLLHAVPESVRDELVAGRKMGVFSILTHLFLTYCPGGVMEKTMLLRNLEEPPEVANIGDAPAALRKWMRWKARTAEIGAVIPDAALLLKGLNRLTKRVLDSNRDLQFRIQLARSSLGVDTTPTELSVSRFATHLLAEIEQVALTEKRTGGQGSRQDAPKLKSLDMDKQDKQDKGKGKGKEKIGEEEKGRPACKFYLSEGGCRKGKECSWSHDVRDEKRRCYTCGSTQHLSSTCTRSRGGASSDASPVRQKTAKGEEEKSSSAKDSEAASSSSQDVSMKNLLEEANKMLRSLSTGTGSQASSTVSPTSQEESRAEVVEKLQQQLNSLRMKTLRLRRMNQGTQQGLLDSGASHCLRPRKQGEDVQGYRKVDVALADGNRVQIPITPGGTMVSEDPSVEPIVPMGALMEKLKCEATWKEGELIVVHPFRGRLPITYDNGCPQVPRQLALQLIEELENQKMGIGEKAEDFQREFQWMKSLVEAHPLLRSLPPWIKQGLPCEVGEWGQLPANKRTRKRMKRDGFVLHLFAGSEEGHTLKRGWQQAGGQDWQILEVDQVRGEGQDMLATTPYGSLLRAALEGKIKGIVAGPNCRTRSVLRHYPIEGNPQAPRPVRSWGGGEFGAEGLTEEEKKQVREDDLLLWRTIFLYVVAVYAARARGESMDPVLSLEQPASPKQYKPEVVSFWDTTEWKQLKEEFNLKECTFQQGHLGGKTAKPTTFGGSLDLHPEDYKIKAPKHQARINDSKELSRWPPAVMRMLAEALMRQVYKAKPKLKPLSWQEHLAMGHVPYRRDCRVCQETMQQCAPHRKAKHVAAGVLSIDTAGPLIPAYDQGGGKARYFLVGALTWRVPRGFEKLKQPPHEPLEGDEPKIEEGDEEEAGEGFDEEDIGELPPLAAGEQGLAGGELVRLPAGRGEEAGEQGLARGEPVRLPAPPQGEEAGEQGLARGEPVRLPAPPEEEEEPGKLEEETELRVYRMALPMVTKTAREVSATAMEFVLRLRADGYHIGRIHCDRGHEFEGAFGRWARSRGIYVTKTAGDDPQGNGRAEVAVKAIKAQVRRTLRQAELDSSHWPWALRYVDEINRCVRRGTTPDWPRFHQEVRVRKRTWRRGAFEPVVERVHYLCPSIEDHGHWVQKPGEPPRVTKYVMQQTTEPVDNSVWVALEKTIPDAWSVRRRLRGKTAVRKLHRSLREEKEDEAEDKRKEEVQRIHQVIEEEMRLIVEEEPQIAADMMRIIGSLKKMATGDDATEEVLQTKIVSPKEVARCWSEWLEAIDSEVKSLTEEKEALRQLTKEEHEKMKVEAEKRGRKVEYLPSKVVFTLKPSPGGGKRKARWVVCGNFEEKRENEETYSGGADATAFRVLVWVASKFDWVGCIIDIKTAFLNAEMEVTEDENDLLILPPSIMTEKGYLPRNTVYKPLKAVYGFRRSPHLWGNHRDKVMRGLQIKVQRGESEVEVCLVQLESEPNLWKVIPIEGEDDMREASLSNHKVLGLVMTYVDDICVVGEDAVVSSLIEALRSTWTTSEPEWIGETAVRFLGMEVVKLQNESGSRWFITQESYIRDLLSRYESEETVRERRTPITRDQSIMEEDPETPALHQVRRCQKEVGELLWLVTRTRPDLMFSVARMGTNVTKATKSVLETASQTRGYLKRTVVEGLMMGEQKEREVCIQAFADASFSPDGEESHGSYVVFANDSPLFWRSGRQTTVTLSTAESELTELVEAISAGEAVAVIVSELFQDIKKFAWSDSQSALAILVNEGGNWRTRHLRMRAAYTRQAVHSGEWGVGHLPGDRMVADIGTKALASQRIDVLKQHLGMSSIPMQPSVIAPATSVAALKPSVIAHATSEDTRKGMDGAKMSQAATALKLITLAAMISAGKSQEEEDMEEGQKELQLIMAAFAILVVLITLVAQHVWKVGVGLWNRGNEQIPEKQIRSLPAQEGRRSDQTADQRKAGSADGEKGLAEREPVRLPSGDREKALQPSLLGEKGLARGEPVRLPGPEATSSGLSGGPRPGGSVV